MAGASQPTTAPATTGPAAPLTVMLLPFNAVGQNGEKAWISQAVDEDLAHDLSRNSAIHLLRPATTQPLVATDGLTAARSAKAVRLISGSYQVVDDQLRITAEVIDVNQTQQVGQLKATGRVRDLFQMEDSLATQLWHILPQPADPSAATDFQVTPLEDYSGNQAVSPPSAYQSPPADVTTARVYDSAPSYAPDYGNYSYGSFGYGYPYGFGFPLFIYGGYGRNFDRHRFDERGFDHHDADHHGLESNRGQSRGGELQGHHEPEGARAPMTPHPVAPRVAVSPGIRAGGGGGSSHFGGHR